jgi:methionine-rich copper-binding protein CopC
VNPVVPRSSRLRILLTVLAVMVGVLLGTATAAQAHTALASTNPAEGSTLTGPLPAVELTFTGPVLLREVTVTGPTGASSAAGAATASGAVVSQPVALDAAGTYTVGYAVTSSDGHILEGALTFGYAPPAPPTTAPATTSSAVPASSAAAEPSEASAESPAAASNGVPVWLLAVIGVLVVAAAVLVGRQLRSRR